MKKINSTKKAVEFLAKNPTGKLSRLEKLDKGIFEMLESVDYLVIEEDKYRFTQEGVDFYTQNYAPKDKWKKSIWGFFPRIASL